MTGLALVHWGEGWKYHGTPGTGTLGLSHSDYTVEADLDKLVDAELAEATDDADNVSVQLRVTTSRVNPETGVVEANGDDRPFIDFDIGDAVQAPDIDGNPAAYRVMSITASEDGQGVVAYDLELNSLAEEHELRTRRWLDLTTPGSLSGRGDNISASDLGAGIPFGTLPKSELPVFNQNTYLLAELDPDDIQDEGHSDWHTLDENILLYRHPWILSQAGDTDTVVTVRYREPDQTTIHNFGFTIKAGVAQPDDSDADNSSFFTNLSCLKGGAIQIVIDGAGDFAYGLEWRSKHTSQT